MAEKSLGRLEGNNELVVFSPLRSHREDPVHQPAPDAAAAAAPHRKNVVAWPTPPPPLLLAPPPSSSSAAAVVAADWLKAGSSAAGFFPPSLFGFPPNADFFTLLQSARLIHQRYRHNTSFRTRVIFSSTPRSGYWRQNYDASRTFHLR